MLLAHFGWVLAQADGNPGAGIFGMLPAIVAIVVLYYFMFARQDRRRQTAQKDLLGGLKKNDRVVTVGGIYGVVMSVQRDADEVTLKVDETTNTKLRVTIGSIARVIADDSAAEPAKT